jgi:hypothetical protein
MLTNMLRKAKMDTIFTLEEIGDIMSEFDMSYDRAVEYLQNLRDTNARMDTYTLEDIKIAFDYNSGVEDEIYLDFEAVKDTLEYLRYGEEGKPEGSDTSVQGQLDQAFGSHDGRA